jgi:putative ABC transport system permease protein
MAASLLIMLHVGEELSYERCFPKADRIDRVIREMYDPPGAVAKVCPPLGRTMQQLLPGVEQWARFHPLEERTWRWQPAGKPVVRFRTGGGYFVDPAALQIFDLRFIAGDPVRALARPDAVVLTAALARKYFPGRDPLKETLVDDATNTAFTITGVVEDLPAATHLRFSYLLPMETLFALLNKMGETGMDDNRFWDGMYMYTLRSPGVTREQLEAGMPDLTVANFSGGGRSRSLILSRTRYRLQPITDIHLRSRLIQEMGPNSDIAYVYIFSAAAVLILLIAVANFINLSTALAFKRMKEIGVKKVLGATRRNLIGQSLVEAFGYILAAGLLALLLVRLAAPLYAELAGRPLPAGILPAFAQIGWGALGVILLTLLAGSYPALYLARFRPAHTLKGMHTPLSPASFLRNGLVVFQFVISVLMIFGTLVIHRQLDYFHERDLGFDRVNVAAIPLQGQLEQEIAVRGPALKAEFRKLAGVQQVGLADNLPGDGIDFSLEPLRLEGQPADNRLPSFRWMRVDEDFLSTLGISLVAGRPFDRMAPNATAFIVNRTAAKMLGRPDPSGLRAVSPAAKADIIGVVEDFQFASLHNQMEPLVLHYQPARARYMLVKLQPGQVGPTLASMRRRMAELVPDQLFDYILLDDNLHRLYVAEDRIGRIFALFAGLGIVIACLGLLGLSAYSAEVRTKEIGIRKVLGATAGGIVWMLASEYCRWVMLASAVALAAGYYLMSRWLEQFAYRTTIDPGVFVATGLLAACTALAAVSGQALRAARSRPVKALRYE